MSIEGRVTPAEVAAVVSDIRALETRAMDNGQNWLGFSFNLAAASIEDNAEVAFGEDEGDDDRHG